ncbi:hypothetical protein [Skermania sp. ID1734]|uniref:hypothetical protein n=1 Tax=Skermania sp. ID1734 TaxID=2597516 RepID=UPI00163DCF7F|nr:hypothetical protein [Skermania sp. ID1734]
MAAARIDEILNAVTRRLHPVVERRIRDEGRNGWGEAYEKRGPGSTAERARTIVAKVYRRGAPIPEPTSISGDNRLLNEISTIISEVSIECNFVLV